MREAAGREMTSVYRNAAMGTTAQAAITDMIDLETVPQHWYDKLMANYDREVCNIYASSSTWGPKPKTNETNGHIRGELVWYRAVDSVYTFMIRNAVLTGQAFVGQAADTQIDLGQSGAHLKVIAVDSRQVAAQLSDLNNADAAGASAAAVADAIEDEFNDDDGDGFGQFQFDGGSDGGGAWAKAGAPWVAPPLEMGCLTSQQLQPAPPAPVGDSTRRSLPQYDGLDDYDDDFDDEFDDDEAAADDGKAGEAPGDFDGDFDDDFDDDFGELPTEAATPAAPTAAPTFPSLIVPPVAAPPPPSLILAPLQPSAAAASGAGSSGTAREEKRRRLASVSAAPRATAADRDAASDEDSVPAAAEAESEGEAGEEGEDDHDEEEELNSDDDEDVDGHDDGGGVRAEPGGATDQEMLLVCQYEKVRRKGDVWRVGLKAGTGSIFGVAFAFARCDAEFRY